MDDLALGGNRLATNHRSTGASPVVVPDLSRKCPIFSLRVSRQKVIRTTLLWSVPAVIDLYSCAHTVVRRRLLLRATDYRTRGFTRPARIATAETRKNRQAL